MKACTTVYSQWSELKLRYYVSSFHCIVTIQKQELWQLPIEGLPGSTRSAKTWFPRGIMLVQTNAITTHGKRLPNFHPLPVNQIWKVWYSQWLWWSGCSSACHCFNLHSPPSWFLMGKWNLQINARWPKNGLPKMSPTRGWCALANSSNADYSTEKQSSRTTTNLRLKD